MTGNDLDLWHGEGRRVLLEASEALVRLADRLDKTSWSTAVQLIVNCKGRVVVTGMGKSGLVGRKLMATLASTGTHACFLHPAEAVHGDLGMLAPDDVVIALSYSGETDELTAILPAIGGLGLPIIAITSNHHSSLSQASAVVLDAFVEKEACPMKLAPTTSTTAMIALGDALAVAVMGARGFGEDDYAKLHPAGTLGRRMLLRVADIMQTGETVAIVDEALVMTEVMLAITRARAGAAIVVDANGRVSGLISEGDIRRHLLEDPKMLTQPAPRVTTVKPGVVSPNILAVEGLSRLMEFHPNPASIAGDAPVVDDDGRPLGMLTLKDLVRAGIHTA